VKKEYKVGDEVYFLSEDLKGHSIKSGKVYSKEININEFATPSKEHEFILGTTRHVFYNVEHIGRTTDDYIHDSLDSLLDFLKRNLEKGDEQ